MRLLVTGGAGYIGSHVVRLAQNAGHEVEVLDDLSTGIGTRITCPNNQLDLSTADSIEPLIQLLNTGFDAVIHLAAKKQVGESVQYPEFYYQQNVGGLANLLSAIRSSKVRKFVFSSSAAAYGMPDVGQVKEADLAKPINPYGETKLIGEWMASNAKTWGLRSVSLRYFNVAGTGFEGLADTAALNLIPIVMKQLRNDQLPQVFGNDYPTVDGTCVRDYVHVLDLARAHLVALDYLDMAEPEFELFNIGTGVGASVLEVLGQIKESSGMEFEPQIQSRRAGDPARLVADVTRSQKVLGFSAEFSLKEIVESAWT